VRALEQQFAEPDGARAFVGDGSQSQDLGRHRLGKQEALQLVALQLPQSKVASVSSMAADSMISRVSRSGFILRVCGAAAMRCGRARWRRRCADRLMATRTGKPWSRQARALGRASSMTQAPQQGADRTRGRHRAAG
jgi:hypothetical protein